MSDTIQQAISNYNKVIVDALEQMKVIHSKYVYANPEDLRKYYDRTREIIEKKTIEINERKDYIDECINMINNQPDCIANGKEQGYFSGSCYEEGVMNILIKESRFKRNVFIDMDKTFILNGTLPGESISDSMLFLHSPAVNNSERAEIFKKYV